MSAFLCWIAGRYDELQERLQKRSLEIRGKGRGRAVHARLPGALAQLQSGFELWLEFALETGTISSAERNELGRRCEHAFQELADHQTRYHHASDPARQFISLLKAALAYGHAHVSDRKGNAPESPESWGWRGNSISEGWTPQGVRIGWLTRGDLFLEPASSYRIAQGVVGTERLPISQHTLHHSLQESGFLVSVDRGRQMVQVRRTLEGCSRQVLHLKARDLTGQFETTPKS
jgi:hypothetical protein